MRGRTAGAPYRSNALPRRRKPRGPSRGRRTGAASPPFIQAGGVFRRRGGATLLVFAGDEKNWLGAREKPSRYACRYPCPRPRRDFGSVRDPFATCFAKLQRRATGREVITESTRL